MTAATVPVTDLSWLANMPGRCPTCLFHVPTQGHRLPCAPSGLGFKLAVQAQEATSTANPDDATRVDLVLDKFIRRGKAFSANDTRPYLGGVKGAVVGARFGVAARAGRMVRTGERVPSTDPGTHGHHIDVWIAA